MNQRKSRDEVLDDFVAQGVITEQQATEIAEAPQWSFSVRELLTYLAAIIIAVGVIRILAIAFQDASEGIIVTSLYLVAVAAGFASWKLSSGSDIRDRVAEVLELAALGCSAGASAVLLSNTELRGEVIGLMLTSAGLVWGLYRCRATRFAGTVALCVGANGLAISLGALIDSDRARPVGVLMVLSGLFLVFAGTQKIGAQYFARAVGSLFVVIGSITLSSEFSNGRPIPILTGVVLFAAGAKFLAPEMLIAGAFCVVIGTVMSVNQWVDNEMAQGLVIIGAGVVMLVVLTAQMKRISNRQVPGVQAA
jgi:hypothetical protein